MEIVLQILLAVVLLAGLITVIMSVKNWHWAQMLLLLAVFFSALGTLVLGLEVYRIHRIVRSKMPALEQQLADVEAENQALTLGGDAAMATKIFPEPGFDVDAEGSMPSLNVWMTRLQDVVRQRGRVWRGVTRAGNVEAATGRVQVAIENPQPHGLEQDAIVYLFEQGEPNAASPPDGSQYLGDFRVVQVTPTGATLEAVQRLDNRTGNRLAGSQKPWVIYETMPDDRHDLFAGVPEEQLRQWLPESTVEQYLRHGQRATDDDDELHKAGFDEQGRRLGPDNSANVTEWRYDRPLRDYAYLFEAAHREMVELLAERSALTEDAKKLAAAHENAKKLGELRTEEKQGLTQDLAHMTADREAIETQLATVQRLVANVQRRVAAGLAENARLAGQLKAQHQQRMDDVNQQAPPPSRVFFNPGP